MKKLETLIIVICLLVAVTTAGALVFKYMSAGQSVPAAPMPLPTPPAKPTVTPEPSETDEAVPEPTPEPVILDKYKELLDFNPYVSGWLVVEGANIDDPVVYTPGSQNYFLHRDINGNPLEKGTFFIAINWHEGCYNTLIYGHNMKNGDGFGSLLKLSDESYWKAHPYIRFDTLTEETEYELLGVFYSQIDEDELETEEDRAKKDAKIEAGEINLWRDLGDEDIYRAEKDEDNGRFRYYYYTDLSDKADYDYYVNNVKEMALYDTGVDAKYGDELLTMSTCSYQVKNGRFVVVAVHRKDEE